MCIRDRAKYHQLVHGVDVAVGMIMEAVQRTAVADNTIIVFTSDNGYFAGRMVMVLKCCPMKRGRAYP